MAYGPPPKDPKLKQRRNKEATAATLTDENPPEAKPELPPPSDCGIVGPWHKKVVELWNDIWSSAMASEYTKPDIHGLVMLMHMQHRYWNGEYDLDAEIRLQRQCYGLTNLDRRRLQWEIKRVEPNGKKTEAPKKPERLADPRSVLKAVK